MRIRSLACVLLFCMGCGERAPVAPVSGTITYEGKPLVGASVTTQPISADGNDPGPGSFATTDEQGRFELELVKPAIKGAIIGEHRVMISPRSTTQPSTVVYKAPGGEEFRTDNPNAHRAAGNGASKWPARFTNGSLQLTVPPEGRDDANFDLTLQDGRK